MASKSAQMRFATAQRRALPEWFADLAIRQQVKVLHDHHLLEVVSVVAKKKVHHGGTGQSCSLQGWGSTRLSWLLMPSCPGICSQRLLQATALMHLASLHQLPGYKTGAKGSTTLGLSVSDSSNC